jgi:hypothetical protein
MNPDLHVGQVKSGPTVGISMEHWWQKNLCTTSAILDSDKVTNIYIKHNSRFSVMKN